MVLFLKRSYPTLNFWASYLNCVNRLFQIEGHTFRAIIFLHKIYEIFKKNISSYLCESDFLRSESSFLLLLYHKLLKNCSSNFSILFCPEALKLSNNLFFLKKKSFQMQHCELQVPQQQNFTLYIPY
jgi:hypothetical protein